MTEEQRRHACGPGDSNVADYKLILRRCSTTGHPGPGSKLAAALGKNRSFVTQITNPAYLVPIPAKHVAIIFESAICPVPSARHSWKRMDARTPAGCAHPIAKRARAPSR
jgi:hypothetical protein